jgi:beta-lactam-binding protein with PASTA domain/tRNA A-37 threonylcarbamoyl transferase component Bud32
MSLSDTTLDGRYLLGPVIGTGGMSDVYAATDELLGRDVAVKMMRADLARDSTFLERFRREAQNAAKLNHHAIVAVYDTGQTDEASGSVPYIVMERVHGETLREIVQDSGPMPLEEASRVMAEVCRALAFSHEAGIIHRDIKPANIMITNTGAVKVMDFGIARALTDSTSAMTQTSAVIGTAQYLSPEQARGKSADNRSDLYASGCVYYEIVTGRPPFTGESPFSVAFQHVQDNPEPPSAHLGLDDRHALALDAVTLTAMAKDPADRYDSALEMADDLQRVAEGHMPLAAAAWADTTDFSSQGGGHEAATTVFPAAGAAAGGAAVGAGAAAAAQQPPQPPQPTGPHDDDAASDDGHRKRRRWTTVLWSLILVALVAVGGYFVYNTVRSDDNGGSAVAEQVSIPDVTGKEQSDAENTLTRAGFTVSVREQPDADLPRGSVIGTDPAANSSVPKGSQVTLIVSSGKEITDVPDLTGMTTSRAEKALSDAGLKLKSQVAEQASDTVPAGQIMTQNPAQGSQVSKGTEVAITVSTGSEQVRVPTVTGQTVDEARANLEGAGFVVQVNEVDSTQPTGRVLSASDEGARVAKGTTITLTVSKGNQIQLPDLNGKDFSDVFGALRNAGWEGSQSDIRRDNVNQIDPLAVDKVVGQSPSAGATVGKNDPVTVRVNVLGVDLPRP